MGKRGRRRVVPGPAKVVTQTARVRVDDETWAEWRHVLGERSVAEALGAFVELEVARAKKKRLTRSELTEREALEVLERIEVEREALEMLVHLLMPRLPPRRDAGDAG